MQRVRAGVPFIRCWHGSRAKRGVRESEIDLWSLERDPDDDRGWSERDDDVLTVSDLRKALTEGLGRGQVVFTMTQCHSGGRSARRISITPGADSPPDEENPWLAALPTDLRLTGRVDPNTETIGNINGPEGEPS